MMRRPLTAAECGWIIVLMLAVSTLAIRLILAGGA